MLPNGWLPPPDVTIMGQVSPLDVTSRRWVSPAMSLAGGGYPRGGEHPTFLMIHVI